MDDQSVDPGQAVEIRLEVTLDGTNAFGVGRDVPVTATSQVDPTRSDTVVATTKRAAPPITAVDLTLTPASPVLANTPVTMTATVTGGGNVEYRFMVSNGSIWAELRGWGGNTFNGAPSVIGSYILQVRAREVGSNVSYAALKSIPFAVNPPISAVTLRYTPSSPATPGTAVTFTATPVGGGRIEYRYMQQYNGAWTEVRGWNTSNTFVWTPTLVGAYAIQVRAREVGTTVTGVMKATSYKIAPPITSITLTGSPASPVTAGTPVSLTAQSVGGTTPEYRFLVRNPSGTWVSLQGFDATTTCTWTPSTPGAYLVQLRVREQGSVKSYDLVKSISYYGEIIRTRSCITTTVGRRLPAHRCLNS